MSERPYTLLSCSVSLDGYLGDQTPRLALSNEADFDRVDEVRASCDAIMVGAVTVRTDNPRLLVRSHARRQERTARGLPSSPAKITVTNRADLDARSNFFTAGEAEKLVYTPSSRVADARARLAPAATIVDGGRHVRMRRLTEDLGDRGVERLMVEGGGIVHTQFLADDLVDELHLVVARRPDERLGPASWVTLARATLAVGVAALAADSFTHGTPVALLVTLAAVALALDAADGSVARRTGTAAPLGARFDGEVDAFLILALSVYVAPMYGAWVLAIGAARYLFLAGEWLLPWMRAPLPARRWRKLVAATQGVVLTVAAAGVLPRTLTQALLVAALALLAASMGECTWWLWRRRDDARAQVPEGVGQPERGPLRTGIGVALT